MAEIATIQFADGVDVGTPTFLAKIANKLANYADDAAFVTANGAATEGNAYWNTTEKAVRVYSSAAWLWIYPANKISVSCLDNQTDTDITGAVWDKANIQTVKMHVSVFRRDDTQNSTEVFELTLIKDQEADSWLSPKTTSFEGPSGVTFSVSATGQLRYSSSNFAGANYSGNIRISNIQETRVS